MRVVDPLAQTFFVEESSGIFVTSIDLFFYSKDQDFPVTIQLRPIELGLPSEKIYPFSEIVVDPKDIIISEDSSIPTRIRFDSPVYLLGQRFHSIVLFTNSDNYRVWTSKLGEIDVTLSGENESNQILISKQPLSGGLFKSQNSSSWVENPSEDLKFSLYKAKFTNNRGNFNFFNSNLDIGNKQISNLLQDPFDFSSRKIRIGFQTNIQDTDVQIGNTIIQQGSNASGNYIGSSGSSSGELGIINSGIGYTPSIGNFTFNDISLSNFSSSGKNATADITISNGVAIAATINSGGFGYSIGDVLTVPQIGEQSLGRGIKVSVQNVNNINEFILDNVQGDFKTGIGKTIQYINDLGDATDLNSLFGGNVLISSDGIEVIDDGLHFRVNHKNHGMHSGTNAVKISNASSDIRETKLISRYEKNSTDDIFVENVSSFSTFENVGVSSTNPGYILIGDEIISYEGVASNSLTNITRQIDETKSFNYDQNTPVYKYELNGISLRRINTKHFLQDSDVEDSIDLDYYTIKIDTSSSGKLDPLPYGQVDRSLGNNFPKLYINESKSSGGNYIYASQNIQYEIIRPNIQTLSLSGTNISARMRTVSGTSVGGNEESFRDNGFSDINLNTNNYFDSPRLVCSKVNEDSKLSNLPGNKSLNLSLSLTTTNPDISPVIDLDRASIIFVSNRINNPIKNYIEDNRVSSLKENPSSFVYATNTIELEIPATSIKVLTTAYINNFSDIRMLYSIKNDPNEESIYSLFPGYKNIISPGKSIDQSLNDGTPDKKIQKTDILEFSSSEIPFKEYEFTVDNLPSFRYFSIKIIGSSTNQAFPPRLRDLRVIALA